MMEIIAKEVGLRAVFNETVARKANIVHVKILKETSEDLL
ncbi:hypothetical protein wcw_1097 [Waddlia chondrophila WSU 86-1044]|uniref:Uncharacterized protein n=1 Tax=Waddlia chondrophila (strain ATCC VR-1470 / WSU 86-1044) TaxID=716544 RepID=D6YWE3_WADCW|nr:hypothetical protein wcw_1097 [Waddlia chondrophila WSU 86-1044]